MQSYICTTSGQVIYKHKQYPNLVTNQMASLESSPRSQSMTYLELTYLHRSIVAMLYLSKQQVIVDFTKSRKLLASYNLDEDASITGRELI